MPETGLCTDLTCDKEIKQLYECHCCSGLICFTHLLEHVEIKKKQNKDLLDSLTHELVRVKTTLELIIEKKLLVIEREKKLIQQAKKLLDEQTCSVDEMQNIFEQINQAITSNPIEYILKVEPSSLDMNASVSIDKCDVNENNSHNDHSYVKSLHPESRSSICLDLTNDSDEVEQSTMSENNEDSMFTDRGFSLRDRPAASKKHEGKKQNETKSLIGLCPLTFDGAYGLTKAKHSIHICSNENLGPSKLYYHFIHKHNLKPFYARRLVQAVANDQDPMTTKLFHGNANLRRLSHKISCPVNNGILSLPRNINKTISAVPCAVQSISIRGLKVHLKRHHHVSASSAQRLVNHFTSIRMKHDVISV